MRVHRYTAPPVHRSRPAQYFFWYSVRRRPTFSCRNTPAPNAVLQGHRANDQGRDACAHAQFQSRVQTAELQRPRDATFTGMLVAALAINSSQVLAVYRENRFLPQKVRVFIDYRDEGAHDDTSPLS